MSFAVPVEDPLYTKRGALYVPPNEGLTRWVSGDSYTMKATKTQTNGSLAFIEATVPPGGGPIAHSHAGEDEAFYILSGELEFLDGDTTFTAGAGSFVFIPRNHRHRFKNISQEVTRTLFLFTPGGPEDLFIEGGDIPEDGKEPQVWDMERAMQLGDLVQRTGLTVLPEAP